MKQILTLTIFLLVLQVNAQVTEEWVARYDGLEFPEPIFSTSYSLAVAFDQQGNVYVTGYSLGAVNGNNELFDIATVKYNSSGIEQWVRRYGSPNSTEIGIAMAVDGEDNVYVTGFIRINSTWNLLTLKYSSDGVLLWDDRLVSNGPSEGFAIAIGDDGNVYVTGVGTGAGTGFDYVTIKYSSTGTREWERFYNGSGNLNDFARSIATDNNGNVYVTGRSRGVSNLDFLTIKYNSAGVMQWEERHNGPFNLDDGANSIAVDSEGNVYVTGFRVDNSTTRLFVTIKYNTGGEPQWVRPYPTGAVSNTINEGRSVKVDNAGNVYVTGSTGSNQITTLKYDPSGTLQWVRLTDGSYTSFGGQEADKMMAIDNEGNIYINFKINSDFKTIKYDTDGLEVWAETRNVNNFEEPLAIAVDNQKNIYVTGWEWSPTKFNYITIKYSQETPLQITKPAPNEKWIAGETDTIKWSGGVAGQLLKIEFAQDSALGNYLVIAENIDVATGNFIWDIPENTLTRKGSIRISEVSDPSIADTSFKLKVKGYELTRITEDGDYERFKMLKHNWSFQNYDAMWEQGWYQQFDYANGIDPFTNMRYNSIFTSWAVNAKPQNFPDWPTFVRVFGEDRCYNGNYIIPSMLLRWAMIKGKYGGSCYGFAISSLLAFELKDQWKSRFGVPDFEDLFSLNATDTLKQAINEVFNYQQGVEFIARTALLSATRSANETVEQLKLSLLSDELNHRSLIIQDIVFNPFPHVFSHAVTPFKVVRNNTNPNIDTIYIYDNNFQLEDDTRIIVNNQTNTWEYPNNGWGWNLGGTYGIFLSFPSEQHLVSPGRSINTDNTSEKYSAINQEFSKLHLFTSPLASIEIKNLAGEIIKFEFDDSTLVNTIPESYPIIPITGFHHPPIGYFLPPNEEYRIRSYNNKETYSYITNFSDTLIIIAGQSDVDSTQQNLFTIGQNLIGISNSDPISKNFNFSGVVIEPGVLEKTFDFLNLVSVQNDSLNIEIYDTDKFKLANFGSSKSYNLGFSKISSNSYDEFYHPSLSIVENSSHHIEPNWFDLSNDILTIYVDIGNNGTIDDTLYVSNTVEVEDQGSLISTDSYHLSQNYPNPFNPSTKITFVIPNGERNLVTLKVYDVLGNEVATLMNEYRAAGRYEVNFDGSNLASGMYLYRLQAGSFVETKKMILIK